MGEETAAVASVVWLVDRCVATGYVTRAGGAIMDWSGTAGAGKTVCLHTLAHSLCTYARFKGFPHWDAFARVTAPTGTAARKAGGSTNHGG